MLTLRARYQLFSRLGLLLEAGVSLERAVAILAKKAGASGEKEILESLERRLQSGLSLSRILRETPEAFSALDAEIIAAGETANMLPQAFTDLGESLERIYRHRLQFRADNIYYTTLIFLGCLFLVYFNLMMRWLFPWIDHNELAYAFRWIFPLGLLAVPALYHLVRLTYPAGIDRLLIHLQGLYRRPLLADQAAFARAMALGLRAGIPVPQCLGLAAGTVQNRALRASLAGLGKASQEGLGLSQLFRKVKGLPESWPSLLALAEPREPGPAEFFSQSASESESIIESGGNPLLQFIAFALIAFALISAMMTIGSAFGYFLPGY